MELVTYIESIEEIVSRTLLLHELLEILEDLTINGHLIEISDGVLTEKVELDHVFFFIQLMMQFDVLTAEGAAADSVRCFVHVLLLTGSECQLVDEVKGDGSLSDSHLSTLEVLRVHLSDVSNHFLQSSCGLVFLVVLLALNLGGWIEHDVLVLPQHILSPGHQPSHCAVVPHFLPLVATRGRGDLAALRAIDDDILRHDPLLQFAHFRMTATATEITWRFDSEVGDFLLVSVDEGEAVDPHLFLFLLL
ncbi:hypothetical protein PMAYCL1PPCAC_04121, partial [Pristionchus mayeri]